MNFSSHLTAIKNEIIDSFSQNKEELVNGILKNVKRTAKLLKTDHFEFWMDQLEGMDWIDLPITLHAVNEEKKRWKKLPPKQKDLERAMSITLERLFTFWQNDDLCEMQGQFFYFKNNNNNQIYSQSEFGIIRNETNKPINTESIDIKIATIQDLKDKGIINTKNEEYLLK